MLKLNVILYLAAKYSGILANDTIVHPKISNDSMNISTLPGSPDEEDESEVPVVRFISGQQLFRAIDSIESRSYEVDSGGEVDTLLVTSVFESNAPQRSSEY